MDQLQFCHVFTAQTAPQFVNHIHNLRNHTEHLMMTNQSMLGKGGWLVMWNMFKGSKGTGLMFNSKQKLMASNRLCNPKPAGVNWNISLMFSRALFHWNDCYWHICANICTLSALHKPPNTHSLYTEVKSVIFDMKNEIAQLCRVITNDSEMWKCMRVLRIVPKSVLPLLMGSVTYSVSKEALSCGPGFSQSNYTTYSYSLCSTQNNFPFTVRHSPIHE